jgi:Complex1_LYR-like
LLERYNPSVGMEQDEKVRRTARRVGLELPEELRTRIEEEEEEKPNKEQL